MSEAVELAPYDPDWARWFEQERRQLLTCFPDPVQIEHIGSTSVPGLSAKPILDILIPVAGRDEAMTLVPALETLGYALVVDYPDPSRLVLIKRTAAGQRSHHLHLHLDADEVRRHLLFRDRLRGDPVLRNRYEALKQRLATIFRDDRSAYSKNKTAFIDEVVSSAGGPARKTAWNP